MSQLKELQRELDETMEKWGTQHWPPAVHERIWELKCQIAVEQWLDTFGSTDRER